MSATTMVHTFRNVPVTGLEEVACGVLEHASGRKIFTLTGPMGSGKTTLIKALCRQLGVTDHVTSPTFTIVNEYLTGTGKTVYHFDFYRIKSETEAMDIGLESYLYSGNYCFIEWPEKVPSFIPESTAAITIGISGENRDITLSL